MNKKNWLMFAPLLFVTFGVIYFINKKESITEIRYSKNKIDNKNKSNSEEKDEMPFEISDAKDSDLISYIYENGKRGFALEINGTDEFKTRVKESLRLLWLYDKEGSFKIVRRLVFEIRQSNRTTFYYDGEKPVIEISQNIFDSSSNTYLASVIAHMGWHSYYLYNKKRKNRKEVPPPGKEEIDRSFAMPFGSEFKKFDDLYKVEDQAFDYQISILKKINAPLSEIRKIKRRDYKDFSPAHDGNYFIEF